MDKYEQLIEILKIQIKLIPNKNIILLLLSSLTYVVWLVVNSLN